jgi:monoamine oxidase
MINNNSNPDVVVVGAGAAGIGAGLALTRLGVPHVILESKHRVGGRAYSEASSIGHLWDHGCHWLHSADVNVLRFMAEKIGHQFPAKEWAGKLQVFMNGKWTNSTIREDYVWTLIEKIIATGRAGEDVAAAALLDQSHQWYPMVRHWCQLLYSNDPDELSTGDAGNYSDSGVNLPVQAGYGALIEKLSSHLPVRLNTKVTSIAVMPKSVRVETSSGTIEAKTCIVAVPARVLETQKITFNPALPQHLQQAFQDVPMGWYEKVAFAFDGQVFSGFEVPFVDIFDPVAADTKPLNFELHPFGRPIAVTHFGGSVAKDMVAQGEAAMKAFALEALVKAFGSDIQKRVVASATSRWTADPMIGGAYSCAKPGLAHARKVFPQSIHDRIFLAGEHVHQHYMATCHGAYETGLEAGHKAATAAGYAPREKDPLWLPS